MCVFECMHTYMYALYKKLPHSRMQLLKWRMHPSKIHHAPTLTYCGISNIDHGHRVSSNTACSRRLFPFPFLHVLNLLVQQCNPYLILLSCILSATLHFSYLHPSRKARHAILPS